MDCGTCDSAPTLQVHAPEVVEDADDHGIIARKGG